MIYFIQSLNVIYNENSGIHVIFADKLSVDDDWLFKYYVVVRFFHRSEISIPF